MEYGVETLGEALEHALALLETAAGERGAAFRNLTLATVNDGAPGLRTVVLRCFLRGDRVAVFHTDARSPKVEAVRRHHRAALLGWDAHLQIQLRLDGLIAIAEEAETQREWDALPEGSRATYAVSQAPGTPIAAPTDAKPGSAGNEARSAFCVMRLRVNVLEYLSLSRRLHRRARFDWQAGDPASTWLVP